MSVHTLAPPLPATGHAALRDAGPALLLGLVILGLLFATEVVAAVQVWNESTAYSHCFFVLPIALYLAWDRRHGLAGLHVVPLPWASLLAAPLLVAWLVAERLGIMEGRQLVAIAFVQVLFLAVLGWRIYWAMSAALLYLFFLVPFGAFLTPLLQNITLEMSLIGLTLLGIPFYADEFLIEIAAGRFFVAEACAGLRFLIASVAFGVLYALLIYRSYQRRALFLLASIIIPIIANGIRALGIIVMGHVLGSAEAAAADHILYGWVFFSIVILLLIVAGMPFRQDQVAPPPPAATLAPPPGARLRAVLAAAALLMFAGIGAATAAWLDGRVVPVPDFAPPKLANAAGCVANGAGVLQAQPGSGQRWTQQFMCGQLRMSVAMQVFSTHTNASNVTTARRSLGREQAFEDVEIGSLSVPNDASGPWRLAINNTPAIMATTALWIEGQPARGGLAGRMLQARNSVLGAQIAPVLLAVELHFVRSPLSPTDRERAQILLGRFIAAQPELSEQVAAAGSARGQTPR